MFRYQDLLKEVELFEKHGVETGSIGDSTLGQATPYIFVGNKEGRCIIVQGGHSRAGAYNKSACGVSGKAPFEAPRAFA